MPTSTTVKGLNINELTEAQYDAAVQGGVIGPNELSIITDLSDSIQVDPMPVATSSNVGKIVQFVGNQPTVPASATISQTTGSGLTDLAVDVATFEGAEQPTGDETVAFTASVTTDTSVVVEATPGLDYTFDGAQVMDYFNNIWGYHDSNMDDYVWGIDYVVYTNDGWVVSRNQDGSGAWNIVLPTGITINSTPTVGNYIEINNTMGGTTWTKGGSTVTLGDYGISFTGNPTDGDVLTVVYTAEIPGYDTGYFYVNKPTYTDSSATISQTTGSGLTDLAVDVATFESAEQPSSDETVNFVAASVGESIDPTQVQFDTATIEIDPATFLSLKTSIYGGDWANVMRIYFSYDGDNDSFGAAAFDANNNELGSTGGINPTVWGISVVSGTLPSSGSWGTNLYYTPAGIQWTKGGDTVTLADYGISFTGNPTDGDVLTVAYTAPAISGYAWEQIDVQPSSGGGQTIEYDDIDYVYGVDPTDLSVYFELENLPTGDYYFYVKSLKDMYTDGGNTNDFQTHKVSFHWDSSWNGSDIWPAVRAFHVSPVLEGDYFGASDNYSAFSTGNQPALSIAYNDGSTKFAIKLTNWILAQVYNIYNDVPAAYKISKLYGGATPVSLGVQKIGRYDSITGYDYMANCGNSTSIIPATTYPNKIYTSSYYVNTVAVANTIIMISGVSPAQHSATSTGIHISMSCVYGDFIADIIFNIGGKTEQRIVKASGPFATSRVLVYPENGDTFISLDNAAFAALQNQNETVYVSMGIFGSIGTTELYFGVYESSQFPNYANAKRLPVANGEASYVFDTPILNEYKNVVQYIGETDANYTNGYFYEADGTVVTVPSDLTCTETSSTGTTITCTGSALDGLVNKLHTLTGWSAQDIKNMLNNSDYQWYSNGDSVNPSINWSVYGGWTGQDATDILAYFTFSPTLSAPINWVTSNYQDGHDELQNGVWVQKNVQPGGGLSNDASGNNSLSILGVGTSRDNCVEVGKNANASDSQATVVGRSAQGGYDSTVTGYYASGAMYSAVYGYNAVANYTRGIAVGSESVSNAIGAIQVGKGTNADAGTLKVGLTADGTNWINVELLTAAGLLPAVRLASITGLADGNYKLRLTMSSGVPTLSWVAE